MVSALRAVDRSTLACAALLKRYPPSRLAVPAYLLALHVLCYALIRRVRPLRSLAPGLPAPPAPRARCGN